MFLLRLKIKAVTLLQELRLKKKKNKNRLAKDIFQKKKKMFINEFRNIYIHIYITVAPLQVPFFSSQSQLYAFIIFQNIESILMPLKWITR